MTRCLTLVALLSVAGGCGPGGPPLFPAGGVVVFRGGKPVPAGLVEFVPDGGGPSARGRVGADGRFTLATDDRPGAVAGRHRVVVLPMAVADGAPLGHKHKAVVVHPKHGRFETSGLSATVEAGGANDFRLEVDPAG
jgi:hypothetical protein